MVGMILRNETDIALGDLTISEKRFQVIDFIPFAVESTSFVTKIHKQIVLKPTSFPDTYIIGRLFIYATSGFTIESARDKLLMEAGYPWFLHRSATQRFFYLP
ncbi:hypothetical protein CEXT_787281 [Caerostris extrusa]|uniref:Solute-binding protein family 3/N-terminal domain-containing protein n=1 Tax=Caerostris extrusa TaxID=172846 RepID=A0AAV4UMF5_CAEEX|nr:hypothetical protein CEXT_787281 [Caerostris extrusa]